MQPTYRKQLNNQQLDTLKHLARFRFITAPLLSQYLGTTSRRYTHERLRILAEQAYIGKRYDKSYRLAGRSAEYYLLPEGIEVLQNDSSYSPRLLKLLAKDKNASDRFIRHCLSILAANAQLKTTYGSTLQFRTRSDYAGNELFPQPLPDGYAFIKNVGTKERTHYFIECFDGTMPESVMRATIAKHVEFYDNDNWTTDAAYPTVLLICRDDRLKTKVDKWKQKALDGAWSDDVVFESMIAL
jgi:hypothetical protein